MVTYEVIVPEGVSVSFGDGTVSAKGKLGEASAAIPSKPKQDGNRLLFSGGDNKRAKSLLGTSAAVTEKLIRGVTHGYEYRMKAVYAHFPINVAVQGDKVVIKNFLGEKSPRIARVEKGVKVEVKGQEILVRGSNANSVGQTVGNIEAATRVRKRDTRVFQDGIYLVSRGKEK